MQEDKQISPEIMSIKDVCKYLKISKGTLSKLSSIPRIHIRRRVLYKKSAILQYLNDNTKENQI